MQSNLRPLPDNGAASMASLTKVSLFTLAYCGLAYISLLLTVEGKPASPIWPSSGVALAAVLLMGYRRAWPVAFLGGVWVTLVRDFVLLPSLMSGLGAMLEAFTAAWLLRRLDFDTNMSRLRDAIVLLEVAMLASTLSPSIGLTGYTMGGIADWGSYLRSWYVWWMGDILGILIFAPFVLAWNQRPPYVKDWSALVSLLLIYLVAMVITASIFGPFISVLGLTEEAAFLLYPLLIWVALRYRLRDVCTLLILVALVSSYGTAHGYGPFASPHPESLDELAFFLIVTGVIVLAFNGSAAAAMRANREQQQFNDSLSSLIEAIPDAIFFKDGQGHWMLTNEPAKRLFNLYGHDWQGKTDSELAQERPPMKTVHEICIKDDELAWQAGKLTVFSEFLTDETGLEHEFEVSRVPVFQTDGRRKGLVVIGRDVTARRKLERGLVKVTEYQQRSTGQDLHDNVGQRLVGIAFLAKALEQQLRDRSLAEADQVQTIVAQVNEAIAETKNLARGLMPVELEANGLVAALDALCVRAATTYRLSCHFECQGDIAIQSQSLALNLYRIAQEAVNNAIRHGHAGEIRVLLGRRGPYLELTVQDNGRGFEASPAGQSSGMGMEIMQYRASLIGAALEIKHLESGGVEVSVRVERR